jgi:hypothetical protein
MAEPSLMQEGRRMFVTSLQTMEYPSSSVNHPEVWAKTLCSKSAPGVGRETAEDVAVRFGVGRESAEVFAHSFGSPLDIENLKNKEINLSFDSGKAAFPENDNNSFLNWIKSLSYMID